LNAKIKKLSVVPEIIDEVLAKTSPKRSFSMTEYERFGLVFTKTRVYKFGHCSVNCRKREQTAFDSDRKKSLATLKSQSCMGLEKAAAEFEDFLQKWPIF
jgi:hypothetical protein